MKKRKLTRAEREAQEAERRQALENARRTRELAERALAKLDPEYKPRGEREYGRNRVLENARRTRELAERAQAKLDAKRSDS
jgi:hypothetical protein